MERAVQAGSDGQSDGRQGRNRRHGDGSSPFKLSDEAPTVAEWRVHHDSTVDHTDLPLGFKESWNIRKVVFARYHRYDWKEASLHRALGSWDGNSVESAACRLHGTGERGVSYSIRIRGVSITLSGGENALHRLIGMAIRIKHSELQFATNEVESDLSRGCSEEEGATGTSE